MRAALALAARGLGRVAPNPAVGCVIVKDGSVGGRGWTAPGGRPHAETQALEAAGPRAKGATAYVTLEPCSHHGKTPPCAQALASAGITRCVVAARDPDSRVDGRGLAHLEASGINVTFGVCRKEAEDLNAGFILTRRLGRPLVTLKLAASLDGRIACANGHSRWVTGALARRDVHLLRATHDAVMVGGNTALKDAPRLDVRLSGLGEQSPLRVVLDGRGRIGHDQDLFKRAKVQPTCLITGDDRDRETLAPYVSAGVEIVQVPRAKDGFLDLESALSELAKLAVTRLLVEGGGGLAAALVQQKLVDRIIWYGAPSLVGGDAIAALGPLGLEDMGNAPRFLRRSLTVLGDDLRHELERTDRPWRSD